MSYALTDETLRAKIQLFVREFGPLTTPRRPQYARALERFQTYHLSQNSISATYSNQTTLNVMAPGVHLGASRDHEGLILEAEGRTLVNGFGTADAGIQSLYGPSYTHKQRLEEHHIGVLPLMESFAESGLCSAATRPVFAGGMNYITSEGDRWRQIAPGQAAPRSMWRVTLVSFPHLTIFVTFGQNQAYVPTTRTS